MSRVTSSFFAWFFGVIHRKSIDKTIVVTLPKRYNYVMTNVNKPNKIIVHHSASPRDTTTIFDIDEWHKKRGFLQGRDGHYVGYHYVITGDGQVHQTKDDDEEGCHTLGQNLQSIGICLTGNFDTETPSDNQGQRLGELLLAIRRRYGIAPEKIFPHRQFAQKDCYGLLLSADWAEECALQAEILELEAIIILLKKRIGIL